MNSGTPSNPISAAVWAQLIDVLFHGVADIDRGRYLAVAGFALDVAQYLGDLRTAAPTLDTGHEPGKEGGVARPFGRAAFIEATEVDELDIKSADGFGRREHVALDLQCTIPGRLAAHGRIHGEDEPSALTRSRPGGRANVYLGDERRDVVGSRQGVLGVRSGLGWGLVLWDCHLVLKPVLLA